MLSLVCLTFISLLVVCSASWSIKHEQAKDYDPFVVKQEVYDKISPDTSSFFESVTTYNGDYQKPTINNVGADTLYGKTAAELNALPDDQKPFVIEWQAGQYFNKIGGTKDITQGDIAAGAAGYAGVHYYRIVDRTTGTVICYKHAYTINKAAMSAPTPITLTPGFTHETKSYTVAWALNGVTKKTHSPNESITSLMARNENKDADGKTITTFQNSQALAGKFTLDPAVLFATDEPFINNYDLTNASTTVSFVALSKAYVQVASGAPTYYGTLGEALTNSGNTANTTVVALQGFECTYTSSGGTQTTSYYTAGSDTADAEYTSKNKIPYTHELNGDYTVQSNVTLLIPYDTGMGYYNFSNRTYTPELITTSGDSLASNYLANSAYNDPTHYLKNTVTIAAGHKLSINGKLVIPGVISGGAGGATLASVTGGNHSRINLNAGASIVNTASTANITCYGYIDEKGANTKVDVATGNIDVVFSIVEHRGGAIFLAMAGGMSNALNLKIEDCAPFNRFYVESVTSQIQITEGANMRGYYDIYVGDQHFTDHVGFFGSGANYFLGFDPNDGKPSKAFLKYDPTEDQNILKVQGNAAINKIEMNIKVGGAFSVTLSTQWVYLPLSHYWDVTFQRFDGDGDAATITATGQDIKIMAGATLNVEEGVTVNGRNIIVYTKDLPAISNAGGFDYFAKAAEDASGYDADPEAAGQQAFDAKEADTYTDGVLNLGGTLNLSGGLGGKVTPTSASAKLKASSSSVTTKELETSSGTGFNGEVTYTNDGNGISISANGSVATSTGASNQPLDKTGTYMAVARENEYAWFAPQVKITLNANGGTAGTKEVLLSVDAIKGITNLLPLTNATVPTRDGYKFAGWYLESACTNDVASNASQIRYDTQAFAKWSPLKTLTLNANGGVVKNAAGTELSSIQVAIGLDDIVGTLDALRVERAEYQFLGWYLDSEFTKSVNENVAEITEDTQLYAKWEKLLTSVKLTLDYTTNASGKNFGSVTLSNSTSEYAPNFTVTLPTGYAVVDNDTGIQWYLAGWKDANGNKITSVTMGTSDMTVYADWQSKIKLEIKSADGNNRYDTIVEYGTKWYLPGGTYSVSLPNVYANDADTTDANYKWYLKSWTLNDEALGRDDIDTTRSFTESTTITITWGTKHTLKVTNSFGTLLGGSRKATITFGNHTYNFTKADTSFEPLYLYPTEVNVDVTVTGVAKGNGLFSGTEKAKGSITSDVSGLNSKNATTDGTTATKTVVSGKFTLTDNGTTTIKFERG